MSILPIQPAIIEFNLSRKKLKELIWNILAQECVNRACDVDEIFLKLRDLVNYLVETGELTTTELSKVIGDLRTFLENTLFEFEKQGVIYRPGIGKIRIVR